MLKKFLILSVVVSCQTPEVECPAPEPCSCVDVSIDMDDVSLEDCESRLTVCADKKTEFENKLKVCNAKKPMKKKGKK